MNKIIVSIVLAIFLVLGINKITDVVYYVEKPEKSVYQVDSVVSIASTTSTESNSESSESGDIMALFASVNAADGAKIFKKCAACHSIAQGGGNKIGPALWGVIGRKAGGVSVSVLKKMVEEGKIDKDETTVCYVTGNGLKATESIMTVLKKPQVMQADVAKISAVIG